MAKLIECPNCHYQGKAKRYTKGSFLIEIVLWLCFILPGVVYSLWRLTSRYQGCPRCTWPYVHPIETTAIPSIIADSPQTLTPSPLTNVASSSAQGVLPSVETFIDNDEGYKDWLIQHPDGFVLDCYRHRLQSHIAIHQVTCEIISKPGDISQPGELTGKQFFKVCSTSPDALRAWAYRQGYKKYPIECRKCAVVIS